MPGFGPASAPVASCGVLGFLEAPSSYKIDYSKLGWTPPSDHIPQRPWLFTAGMKFISDQLLGIQDEAAARVE